MPQTPPTIPPASPRKNSGCLKVFVGCALVVGVLVFGSCLFSAAAGVYMITTPRQIDPASLIGEETLAVVQFHADLEDPGVAGLIQAFFDALQNLQSQQAARANLPAPLRAIQQMGNQSNRQNLFWLFPAEGIVVIDPRFGGFSGPPGTSDALDDDEEPEPFEVVGALNLDHLPRIYARSLDWVAKLDTEGESELIRHGDHTIAAGHEGAFSLAGGTAVAATSFGEITLGLDRIDAAEDKVPADPHGLLASLARLSGPGDAEGVVRLDTPEVQALARRALAQVPGFAGKDAALGECQRLEGWVDLVDADTLRLHLELLCASDPFGWDQWLEIIAALGENALEEEGLTVEVETREMEGERPGVILDAEVTGLSAIVAAALEAPRPAEAGERPEAEQTPTE